MEIFFFFQPRNWHFSILTQVTAKQQELIAFTQQLNQENEELRQTALEHQQISKDTNIKYEQLSLKFRQASEECRQLNMTVEKQQTQLRELSQRLASSQSVNNELQIQIENLNSKNGQLQLQLGESERLN